MKTKFGKAIRAFYFAQELPPNIQAQINFGIFNRCGCSPEGFGMLSLRWARHDAGEELTPTLVVSGKALRLLWKLRAVINQIWRTSPNISPAELCALLKKLGFTDLTGTLNLQFERPYCAQASTAAVSESRLSANR